MVFMGRGRGRGTSQFASKTGGAISATTRKEKRPTEIYERPNNLPHCACVYRKSA
jgi:hypothetical protein